MNISYHRNTVVIVDAHEMRKDHILFLIEKLRIQNIYYFKYNILLEFNLNFLRKAYYISPIILCFFNKSVKC